MNILLESKKFQSFKTLTGTGYLQGKINIPVSELIEYLDSGKFPHHVRGNFSLVFSSPTVSILAVDHYATCQLFYTSTSVSDVFSLLKNNSPDLIQNTDTVQFIKLYGGYNLSNETTIDGIYRVEPGTYVVNGEVRQYCQIMSSLTYEFDPQHFTNLLMSAIENSAGDKNLIFLSGGKDSSTILGAMLSLNLPEIKTITLYSNRQIYTDIDIVKLLDQEYQTNTIYAECEYSGEILSPEQNDRFFSYWKENPFGAKRKVVEQYNLTDYTIYTGEVGPSVYTQTPLLYYAQTGDLDGVFRLLAVHTMSHHKIFSSEFEVLPSKREVAVADQAYKYYRKTYENMPEGADVYNRILHLQSVDQSCFRLFSYSQDTAINWVHPFADWDFVEYITNIHPKYKLNKLAFREAMADIISLIPWNYPKNGLSIPAISKY